MIVQAGINAFVTWYREPDGLRAGHRRGVRRRPAGAHRSCEPPPNGRDGATDHRGGRGERRRGRRRRRTPPRCARRSCATPARSRSPPPRSTPGPRRCAAPGTPGSRRWSSTRVLRAEADETVRSRASALGWESQGRRRGGARPGAGRRRGRPGPRESIIDDVRRSARHVGLDALCAVQGDRLVVVLGGVDNPDKAGAAVAEHFGDGPGRRRPGGPRPGARQRLGPRRGRRAARRAGLAGGAAAGDQRRPAPRAGALRRRARPPPARPGGLPSRCVEAGVRDARDGVGVPRPRRLDRGHRPGDVRARRTPCATGCGGPPRSPGCPPATRGTPTPTGSR